MAPTQPYLYEATPKYNSNDPFNGFDPKAVTRASRAPPPRAKKQEGPLINFNRHPDSYFVLPTNNPERKPMNPRTKAGVKWVRWIQLGLRQLQLVAAIGLLVCTICIRGTADTEGWIIRIPPGTDIVASTYAIYHLFRPAKGRTPGSSASYHFFALILDAGFVPFYVFIALMANNNRTKDAGVQGRWHTYFNTDDATMKILTTTWLTAVTTGGMHLVSFCLDVWLLIIFRKISNLPPDMNPLEDNLTSRRSTKHKYKDSDATTVSEKRMSDLSSTTSIPGAYRNIQASESVSSESRTIPFLHTRGESGSGSIYSPHTPASARQSRANLEKHSQFYQQSQPHRASRADLWHEDDAHSQSLSTMDSSSNYSDASRDTLPSMLKRNTLASTSGNIQRRGTIKQAKPKRQDELQTDNWFVHMESPRDGYEPMRHEQFPQEEKPYDNRRDSLDFSEDEETGANPGYTDVPAPLRMNPTTPPGNRPAEQRLSRAPTSLSTISDVSSISRASTPKKKFYGSLQSATQGLRSTGDRSPSGRVLKKNGSPEPEMQQYRQADSSPRVVSRTGLDFDGDLGLGAGTMMGGWRRRDVSGKVAEEGRSPAFYR